MHLAAPSFTMGEDDAPRFRAARPGRHRRKDSLAKKQRPRHGGLTPLNVRTSAPPWVLLRVARGARSWPVLSPADLLQSSVARLRQPIAFLPDPRTDGGARRCNHRFRAPQDRRRD